MSKSGKQPIAITGIGCRFPGGVTDPESFWKLLKDGFYAVGEIPPDRFDLETYYDPLPGTPGKTVSRWGGFLEQLDRFDPYFFGISPREAERLNPQQRVLLEENLRPASINVDISVDPVETPETNLDEISDLDLMSLFDGELSRINDLLEGD